ncbi:MAG: DNA topoisomerase [Lachnospiraceae bacterium]|nr:DNA topoisomerase [Lachnospiraceae bacterium]
MGKYLYIAEKPSVAREFARVLHVEGRGNDGYIESEDAVVTWCVGHLVTMSYPEKYDMKYKRWSLETLPFLPSEFKYEVIPSAAKQFKIVSRLLAREDVERIYVCTDSGREGEYIYRLVEQMSPASVKDKDRRRVWIDSQTEEEILRGIREAKPLSEYDALASSAYLRAKEDYLMGINFSRILTLKYGNGMTRFLGGKWSAVSAGRVMTCVLGMVVRREREIRSFVKTTFYRVQGLFDLGGEQIEADWKCVEGSSRYQHPALYKDVGFLKKEEAEAFIAELKGSPEGHQGIVKTLEKKLEKKQAPLLYNLAELQNDCSRLFKISPDQTLQVAQELYEKKMTTYPRTDARVLSTAVAKEIDRNLKGLQKYQTAEPFATEILSGDSYKKIAKTRYTDDKAITDHYAIIPTGAGLQNLRSLSPISAKVYELIVRRFLGIFYPPAEYRKLAMTIGVGTEIFTANTKVLEKPGYLVTEYSREKSNALSSSLQNALFALKKGAVLPVKDFVLKEGETTPPKRYNSGSIILAMENAGQLIEDESLREQIRGSGIGTSATRAEILKKLVTIKYLKLNNKTQIITPELLGEMVYDAVFVSLRSLLNPELTASWEKGLSYVAEGSIQPEEYMQKLETFVRTRVEAVRQIDNDYQITALYREAAQYYKAPAGRGSSTGRGSSGGRGSSTRRSSATRRSAGRTQTKDGAEAQSSTDAQ